MTKLKDYIYDDVKNPINKPQLGLPGDVSTSLVTNGVSISGNPVESSATTPVDVEKSRIGDWYFDPQGRAHVVEGSLTDLKRKYTSIVGGMPRQDLTISDYLHAGMSAVSTGLTTNAVVPELGFFTAPLSFGFSLLEAESKYNEAFGDQDVDIIAAYNIVENEDGTKSFYADPTKMASASPISGSRVKEATDTSQTGVTVGDDGSLNIKASSAFLQSDEYYDVLRNLEDMFPDGLTKEQAKQVANEETGKTLEEQIDQYIKDEESDFYYKAQSIASFKKIAPNASYESLEQACNTQLAGYLKNQDLSKLNIIVYNENGQKEETTAEAYFEKISGLSKVERNDYMLTIGNKIKSDSVSDDEKVILQAQANALYGASDSDESGFKGMYQKDFFDSLADTNLPIFGRAGDFVRANELETFERNAFWSDALDVASFAATMFVGNKITNKLENVARSGVAKAGEKIGGKFGEKMANINKLAPNGELIDPVGTKMSDGSTMTLGQSLARRGAQVAMQGIADLGYDAIEWAAHKASGQDYDFLEQLGTDFLMDTIMSYGPSGIVKAMNSDAYEFRKNKETGEVYRVKLTADEVASKRAKAYLDLTDSNASIKTQETFWDKNAGISRIAVIARWLAPGNKTLYQKALRYSGDIKQVTLDEKSAFEFSSKEVQQHIQDVNQKIKVLTGGNPRNFSQADADYINAKVNRRRFVRMAGDDKSRKMAVVAKYKDAINGVDKERAKQLDELLGAMEMVIRDSVDYYHENGMMTDEEYSRLVDSEVYKNGEFFPVWSTKRSFRGGDIMQNRRPTAELKNEKELYDVEDFDNPLETYGSYINNQMRNIAIQRRVEVIKQIASIPGSPIRIVSDVADLPEGASAAEKAGAMGETEMLLKYSEQFEGIYDGIVEDVNKNVMTYEEWAKDNSDAVMNSYAMGFVSDLKGLQEKRKELGNRLRSLRREGKKVYAEGWTGDDMDSVIIDIEAVRNEIRRNREEIEICRNRIVAASYELMSERMRKNKYGKKVGIPEIDLETIRFSGGLADAMKNNDVYGAIQAYLNQQVVAVNPYISRESVIKAKSAEAAAKYRKKMVKEMRKLAGSDKTLLSRIHLLADKALDKVMNSLNKEGAGEEGTKIDSEDMSNFLSVYDRDNPRTIRYYVDGVQHHITLEGTGAEAMVAELYAPEVTLPTTTAGKAARKVGKGATAIARAKRTLTTAVDIARVAPNLIRDWTRGIVTTGGKILLDPDALRKKALETGKYSPEEIERINDAFLLARNAVSRSTFTQSLEAPKGARAKQMVIGSVEGAEDKSYARRTLERKGMTLKEKLADTPDHIRAGFIHFKTDLRSKNFVEKFSMLQDWAETYTRKRAMDTAYYYELSAAAARGESVDQQIESAMEAAYFAGREATVNFARRGKLIQSVAQFVPYLSQNYSSLESLKYSYLNDPVAVANTMKTTVGAYSALIAIALSNEESRKRYYLLSEHDRANSIIIPLTCDSVVTLPLDENVAAFLTPYRRIIEAMQGNDPSGFYLWGIDFLEALSPADLSGFSEGDKFNLRRGLEKLGAQHVPTVLLPFLENATGRDWYYGTDIKYDADKTGMYYDNPDPSAGEMTSKTKNSRFLAAIADATGIPQWKLQNISEEFGGNVGQYILSTIDKLSGATEENTGGKDWKESIFKPFTGTDSDGAKNAFYDGINRLNEEKVELKKKLKKIEGKIEASAGDEKVKLEQERQKMISDYGVRVTDFVDQYLSVYEITGGLSQKEANTVFYLYDIHGEADNAETYSSDSLEAYYNKLIHKNATKRTTSLAAESGLGKYAQSVLNPYHETYGYQALQNSIYGRGANTMAKVALNLEDTSNYENSYSKLKKTAQNKYSSAMNKKDYDTANAIAYEYDKIILKAILPQLQEDGLEQSLKNSHAVTDYLEDWILMPTDYYKDAKGRWLSKLPDEVSKKKAYSRRFILDMYGLLDEEG